MWQKTTINPGLHGDLCMCVCARRACLEQVCSEMQMRDEESIMARWRQHLHLCPEYEHNVALPVFKLFLMWTNWLKMGHLSRGFEHSHLQFWVVYVRHAGRSVICHNICIRELCSTHQIFLSRVYFKLYWLEDWVALTLEGTGEERPASGGRNIIRCRNSKEKNILHEMKIKDLQEFLA